MGIPQPLVLQVQGIIDEQSLAPNAKWQQIQSILTQEKVMYKLDLVDVDKFLVHNLNRGRLGINAFEAHKHGQNMKLAGGCSAKLHESRAFELPPLSSPA